MKAFFTTILAIMCVFTILIGHAYWKNKTTEHADELTKASTIEKTSSNTPQPANTTAPADDTNNLLTYTKNWPAASQDTFKQARTDKRPFKILLLGGTDLGKSPDGWAYITKDKLTGTFGAKNVDVEISEFDNTSTKFVQTTQQLEIAKGHWDLILFEPFTLNDNGLVKVEDSLRNLTTILTDFKKISPNTVFILQPPHPLYKATYFPIQVNALKKYAQDNNIPFLDHWTAWPNPSTIQIKDYLSSDQMFPNQNGYKVWSDFVLKYFISQ